MNFNKKSIVNYKANPLTSAQRTSLGSTLTVGDKGLQVYDTDLNINYFWSGSVWVSGVSVAGDSTTAGNGLSLSGNKVKLGGTLTENTALNGNVNFRVGNTTPLSNFELNSNVITLESSSGGYIIVDESGLNLNNKLFISPDGSVTSINSVNTYLNGVNVSISYAPTVYAFSGSGDRYVGANSFGQLKIMPTPITLTSLSAVNGITYNNGTGQFKLGGTLTENTTVSGSFNITFSPSIFNINTNTVRLQGTAFNSSINESVFLKINNNNQLYTYKNYDEFFQDKTANVVASTTTQTLLTTGTLSLEKGTYEIIGCLAVKASATTYNITTGLFYSLNGTPPTTIESDTFRSSNTAIVKYTHFRDRFTINTTTNVIVELRTLNSATTNTTYTTKSIYVKKIK